MHNGRVIGDKTQLNCEMSAFCDCQVVNQLQNCLSKLIRFATQIWSMRPSLGSRKIDSPHRVCHAIPVTKQWDLMFYSCFCKM